MQIKRFIKASVTAFIFVFVVAGAAQAASTIGANIVTTGTLSVTGATTMSAALTLTSTTDPQVSVKYDSSNYMQTTVSSTGATTFNITGSTLNHAFTFADSVNIASTTNHTLFTVDGNSSSSTLAVYQAGSGDIVNVFDGAVEVFTILNGGNTGVASSTPYADFSVEMGTGNPAFVVGNFGSTTASLVVEGTSADGNVGIGISNPTASLQISDATAVTQKSLLIVGTTTAESIEIKSTGAIQINDDSTAYIDFVVESDSNTNMFVVDASSNRVGIASTTPSAMFSVGNSAGDHSATSTIDMGMPCFKFTTDVAGTKTDIYYWPAIGGLVTAGGGGTGGWATSTTSCF